MNTEDRLKSLSLQVKNQRQTGHVLNWSNELKAEAVSLMSEVSISKLSDSTNLSQFLLYKWKEKFKDKGCQSRKEIEPHKILIHGLILPRLDAENMQIYLDSLSKKIRNKKR